MAANVGRYYNKFTFWSTISWTSMIKNQLIIRFDYFLITSKCLACVSYEQQKFGFSIKIFAAEYEKLVWFLMKEIYEVFKLVIWVPLICISTLQIYLIVDLLYFETESSEQKNWRTSLLKGDQNLRGIDALIGMSDILPKKLYSRYKEMLFQVLWVISFILQWILWQNFLTLGYTVCYHRSISYELYKIDYGQKDYD